MTNHLPPRPPTTPQDTERGALRAILRQLAPDRVIKLPGDPLAQLAWSELVMDCSPEDIGDPLQEAIYACYFLLECAGWPEETGPV